MKKIYLILAALITIGLHGCASQPTEIKAQDVSTVPYEGLTCEQLAMEMTRVNDRINSLHANLEDKADNDAAAMAVGMLLFWPALFLLEGGDGSEANEYARFRGEMNAIQSVGVKKSCTNMPKYDDPIQKKLEAKRAREAAQE